MVPVIDRGRCEGSGECAEVCPFGVFEVRRLRGNEWGALPLLAKLKVLAHGGEQAFAVLAEECRACNRCAAACPEAAITIALLR
ncbi:MAG: ferredoxin family protein [Alphaproteobacteria bacterium]|nr:ferredoxin family protein [Alphaproteobacteria bacterium]